MVSAGGGGSRPDPRIGDMAVRMGDIGDEALEFSNDYFASRIDPASNQLAQQQQAAAGAVGGAGADQLHTYRTAYSPINAQIAADAMNYDNPNAVARAGQEARALVGAEFDAAKTRLDQDMQRSGVRQTAGQRLAANRQLAMQRATVGAGASNAAMNQRRDAGIAARLQAGSFGNQLQGSALNAIGQGTGHGSDALQALERAGSFRLGGYGTAMTGAQGAGNLFSSASQQAMQARQARDAQLGNLAGTGAALYFLSDPKGKSKRKPANPKDGTRIVRKMPVDEYQHDAADGEMHVGPMADDMAKAIGGNPKAIDVGDMLGLNMLALKDLDNRMRKLEQGKGGKQA